jgi:hypothetical protein
MSTAKHAIEGHGVVALLREPTGLAGRDGCHSLRGRGARESAKKIRQGRLDNLLPVPFEQLELRRSRRTGLVDAREASWGAVPRPRRATIYALSRTPRIWASSAAALQPTGAAGSLLRAGGHGSYEPGATRRGLRKRPVSLSVDAMSSSIQTRTRQFLDALGSESRLAITWSHDR